MPGAGTPDLVRRYTTRPLEGVIRFRQMRKPVRENQRGHGWTLGRDGDVGLRATAERVQTTIRGVWFRCVSLVASDMMLDIGRCNQWPKFQGNGDIRLVPGVARVGWVS